MVIRLDAGEARAARGRGATLPAVNRALAAAGEAVRLYRDREAGYHYFAGGDAHTWPESGVMVCYTGALTVAGWLREFDALAKVGRDPERPRWTVGAPR